jgi:glycosyltransferase 2 family protein
MTSKRGAPFSEETDRPPLKRSELADPLPHRSKLWRYLSVLAILGLAIYFFLSRFVAMERAAFAISRLRFWFVLLAMGAEVLSYCGSGYLLRTAVRLAGRPVSVVDGALMTAGANSVGTLGGGAIGTAGMAYFWLRRRGINPGAAGLGGWLPVVCDNMVLAVLSLAGFLLMVRLGKSPHVFVAGFGLSIVFLAALITVLIWSATHRDELEPLATSIGRFAAKIRRRPSEASRITAGVARFLDGWDALLEGGWRGPVLGAILNASFDMLALALMFRAANYHVSLGVLVAGYALPQLLGKLTIILGGVGVVEAGMIGLYSVLGIPAKTAVIAVLAYRLASFWLPTLAGVLLIPYLDRASMRASDSVPVP